MVEETAWLIERRDPRHQDCVLPNSFLGVSGTTGGGALAWMASVTWALRFARKLDAEQFIGAMEIIHNRLPHSETLAGLRSGDPRAVAVEHKWHDASAARLPEGV